MNKKPTYMTVKVEGRSWDETEQLYLGCISWDEAVKVAKSQKNEVRLSNYAGYNASGHYITPDSAFVD